MRSFESNIKLIKFYYISTTVYLIYLAQKKKKKSKASFYMLCACSFAAEATYRLYLNGLVFVDNIEKNNGSVESSK